jgi:hypothetical protein
MPVKMKLILYSMAKEKMKNIFPCHDYLFSYLKNEYWEIETIDLHIWKES